MPGLLGCRGDDAVHGAPVDRRVLIGDQAMLGSDVVAVVGGPFGEQHDEVGVQRDEPVVAELSDRNPQPIGVADQGDGVGVELAQFAGTKTGAGQHLDHESIAGNAVGPGGGHQLRGGLVV